MTRSIPRIISSYNALEKLGRVRLSDHFFMRDQDENLGATACIQVHWFAEAYEQGADWKALAWWSHDHLPYIEMRFFPKRAAFNLNWRENPIRKIASWIETPRILTKPGMDNWAGDHSEAYAWMDEKIP